MLAITEKQYSYGFSLVLKGQAHRWFMTEYPPPEVPNYKEVVKAIKKRFETGMNEQIYLGKWIDNTLRNQEQKNPSKLTSECFDIVVNTFADLTPGIEGYGSIQNLCRSLAAAVRGHPDCFLQDPSDNYAKLCAQYRTVILQKEAEREAKKKSPAAFVTDGPDGEDESCTDPHCNQFSIPDINYLDRTFGKRGETSYPRGNHHRGNFRQDNRHGPRNDHSPHGRGYSQGNYQHKSENKHVHWRKAPYRQRKKTCWICGKEGCWSSKHPDGNAMAVKKVKETKLGKNFNGAQTAAFLFDWQGQEGIEEDSHDEVLIEQMMMELDTDDPQHFFTEAQLADEEGDPEIFMTSFGSMDGAKAHAILESNIAKNLLTREDPYVEKGEDILKKVNGIWHFTKSKYNSKKCWGLLPDTGAARLSTVGKGQCTAAIRQNSDIKFEPQRKVETVAFGPAETETLGYITVPTAFGPIRFAVVDAETPFLICIQDMTRLGIYLNNCKNILVQEKTGKVVPVTMKFGHPWMQFDLETSQAASFLTEKELRRLHKRFGHPSVRRLQKILARAGYDANSAVVKELTKYCEQCQMYTKSPGRFKFKLGDNIDPIFNSEIVVDIMYLHGNQPVLQVVDLATGFMAARFLKEVSAKHIWEVLKACWIDVYIGPPNRVSIDAGANVSSAYFRAQAKYMSIEVKEAPVEAHNSIGKVERFHQHLRRAYEIILAADGGKDVILTQSPTIQRVSQHLLIALGPCLIQIRPGLHFWLRDISQAYPHSKSELRRMI